MNIDAFSLLVINDDDAWESFRLAHGLAHQTIYLEIGRLNGGSAKKYPMFEIQKWDKDWLQNHYIEHNSIAEALNIVGTPDISSVNFENQDEVDSWMQAHTAIHKQIDEILGLT